MALSTSCVAVFIFLTNAALAAPLVTVQLEKQYVPLKRGEKVVAHKTAYFGSLFVGFPQQKFTVVFDTGSGHLFVPSSACGSQTCLAHKRYNRSLSLTAMDIDHSGAPVAHDAAERDQVSIAFGTGDVLGEFVQDVVCLSEQQGDAQTSMKDRKDCIKVRVITASEMTAEPFLDFAFDGVLGLGLGALAVDPEFSFFGQMTKANILPEPRFGFFLSKNDAVPSELSFGGHDERRVSEPLRWTQVVEPEKGYWQVHIKSIKIGGIELPACADSGKCVGIVDSGTSLLGVPSKIMKDVHWKLARKVPDDPAELDCRNVGGPEVVIELEGGLVISMGAEDYSRPTAMRVESKTGTQVVCRASLLPVDMGTEEGANPNTWILGEPVLRKYYTAFDWNKQEIGFALAKQPPAGEALGLPASASASSGQQPQAPQSIVV